MIGFEEKISSNPFCIDYEDGGDHYNNWLRSTMSWIIVYHSQLSTTIRIGKTNGCERYTGAYEIGLGILVKVITNPRYTLAETRWYIKFYWFHTSDTNMQNKTGPGSISVLYINYNGILPSECHCPSLWHRKKDHLGFPHKLQPLNWMPIEPRLTYPNLNNSAFRKKKVFC